jgi:hypothetical protein
MRTVGETVELGAGLRLVWRPEGLGDGLPWRLIRSDSGTTMWLSEDEGGALIAAFQRTASGSEWVVERDSGLVSGGPYPDALLHLHASGPGDHRALALARWQSDWVAEFLLPHLAAAPVDDLPEGVRQTLVLDAGHDVPPGWERRWSRRRNYQWTIAPNGVDNGPVEVRKVPAPEPDMVPVLDAIAAKRTLIGADGTLIETSDNDDVIVYRKAGRWRVMYNDAGHAEESRAVADESGRVACAPLPKDSEK